jgi:hypothetical protein
MFAPFLRDIKNSMLIRLHLQQLIMALVKRRDDVIALLNKQTKPLQTTFKIHLVLNSYKKLRV